MHVYLNGKIVTEKKATVSVNDHGFLYGDSVYETLRTINGSIWLLSEHLRRLKRSLKTTGITLNFTKHEIESVVSKLMRKNSLKEARIRITISRGINGGDFSSCKKAALLIQTLKLKLPTAEKINKGAK